jgi:hypothetical protein
MSLNANFDIKFKNYEMIKENKLANNLMLTLPDILKMVGQPIQKKF